MTRLVPVNGRHQKPFKIPCPRCSGVGYVDKKRPIAHGEMRRRLCGRCHGHCKITVVEVKS